MASERVIRISTEFDASAIMKGINQMRQELNNLGIDNTLFKDINKDLDKISKTAISVNAALKNGIPEKDINSFLKSTSEASKLFTTLPDKIRQVSVQTSNIHFPREITTRLNEIETEIERLSKEARSALGEDLQKSLRNAIPRDIIDTRTLENITKAQDRVEAFNNAVTKVQNNAQKTNEKINSMIIGLANPKAINPNLTGRARDAALAQNTASVQLSQRLSQSFNNGTLEQDRDALAGLYSNLGKSQQQLDSFRESINAYVAAQRNAVEIEQRRQQILDIINNAEMTSAQKTQEITRLTQEGANLTNNAFQQITTGLNNVANRASAFGQRASTSFNNVSSSAKATNIHLQRQDSLLRQIASRATSLIGVGAAFNYITRGIREAWQGIRELDKEFTQIAVVTDKTTSQLWQSFGTYSQMAQGLGVTTKDAVATSALYYQQGLDTAEVMTLTSETIKMAQIAGMDFATATNQMTAALRGFNLEMDQAGTVNDIFSTLAANAAVSTEELAYALTKTASIADSAGMSIDTTSAFLTKMIETTREAPENIGTAMKSIVARFEELKQNPLALKVEVEGEEIVANKVEAAIALAGVALRDSVTGQFRDLDDVFLELAKSWDSLDRNTQRYIATIAAGSRQQSRFIAMMDGYDRTLELVELAQDSEGQSAVQFLKTLDSLDSKLNKISNSLEAVYRKFVDSDFFGGLLEGLNDFLQQVGKMDAGQIAVYIATGLAIGNALINGIRQAFSQNSRSLSSIIYTKLGSYATMPVNKKIVQNMKEEQKNKRGYREVIKQSDKNIETYKNNIIASRNNINSIDLSRSRKYNNINMFKALKRYDDLNAKISATEFKSDEYTKLREQQDNLTRGIKTRYGINLQNSGTRSTIRNKNEYQAYLTETNKISQNQQNITQSQNTKNQAEAGLVQAQENQKKLRTQLVRQSEEDKRMVGQLYSQVGIAAVMALTAGITQAVNDENPFNALGTALLTFSTMAIPQFISTIVPLMSAGGAAAGKGFGTAFTMAGGPYMLIIAAALSVIILSIAAIKEAIEANQSEAEKLKKQIIELEDKQKKLQETSERSTAEAAVQKTANKKLNNLISNYDKLINKVGRTTEENEKLIEIQNELAENYPDLLDYYDEAGNAKLKERNAWQDIVELQKESTRLALNQAFADKVQLDQVAIDLAEARTRQTQLQENEAIKRRGIISNTDVQTENEVVSSVFSKAGGADNLITKILGNNSTVKEYLNHIFGEGYENSKAGLNNQSIQEYFSEMLSKIGQESDKIKRVDIAKQYIAELDPLYEDYFNKYQDELFKNSEEVLTQYYNDLQFILNPESNSQYKQSQETIAKAYRQLQSDLEKSIKGYIETLSPEVTEGYSEKGKSNVASLVSNKNAEKLTKASDIYSFLNSDKDIKEFYDKIKNSATLTETQKEDAINALLKVVNGQTQPVLAKLSQGQIPWNIEGFIEENKITAAQSYDTQTSAEERDALLTAQKSILEEFGNDTAEQAEEILIKIKAALSDEDFEIFNLDPQNIGLDELKRIMAELPKEYQESYEDTVIKPLIEKIKELNPIFTNIAENFSYNLALKLQEAGLGKAAVNSLEATFANLESSKIPALINIISNIDDWGADEQLKQLAVAFIDAGASAGEAVQYVRELHNELSKSFTINSIDDVRNKFSDIGQQISNNVKAFKDLDSAMKEYNKNGKLTVSTILEVIEAGHIEYLMYDNATKSVQINTAAIQKAWKVKMEEAKGTVELQKARLKAEQAALEAQIKIESKKIDILEESIKGKDTLTREEYNSLIDQLKDYGIDVIGTQGVIDSQSITENGNYFEELLSDKEGYYNDLIELAAKAGENEALAYWESLKNRSFTMSKVKAEVSKMSEYQSVTVDDIKQAFKSVNVNGTETYFFNKNMLKERLEAMRNNLKIMLEQQKVTKDMIPVYDELYEVVSHLTDDASMADYFEDTAEATKEAEKELKRYVDTLERYYDLNRKVTDSERETEKLKREFDKNPTPENAEALTKSYEENHKLYVTELATWRKEPENIRAFAKDDLGYFVRANKIELTDEQRDKLLSAANLAEGQTGRVKQYAAKEILESYASAGIITYDNISEIMDWLSNYEGKIDEAYDKQWEYEDALYKTEEDIQSVSDKLTEIAKKIDPLIAIKAGIEASNKLLDKANELSEDYYESGGREGQNVAEYAHNLGSKISYNDSVIEQIKGRRQKLEIENQDLMQYILPLGEGIYSYDGKQANLDALAGNSELLERVDNLIKQFKDLDEIEDDLEKQNKELAKSFKELLKENRSQYSSMVMKVADALAELDQRQIDEVKKKYAMIQEEDDKYLESLQKSIDKQRQLRDQAKSYDDLEEQEKRLALLERDTSGANAAEIAALKEQIKEARQNLVDTEQDNIVNNIAENNEERKKKMDEETTFLQNVMDERTYDMQYYIDKAYEIVDAAIAGDEGAYQRMIEVLQKTDEEFYKNTREGQQEWFENLETSWTRAKQHVLSINEGLGVILGQTIQKTRDTLKTYTDEDTEYINGISTAIDELKRKTNFIDLETFKNAAEKAKEAKERINEIQQAIDNLPPEKDIRIVIEKWEIDKTDSSGSSGSSGYGDWDSGDTKKPGYVMHDDAGRVIKVSETDINDGMLGAPNIFKKAVEDISGYKVGERYDDLGEKGKRDYLPKLPEPTDKKPDENPESGTGNPEFDTDKYWEVFKKWWVVDIKNKKMANYNGFDSEEEAQQRWSQSDNKEMSVAYGRDLLSAIKHISAGNPTENILKWWYEQLGIYKYAEGGMVNYTGLAWVDGSLSKPEAFLSADDTRNIQTLTEILQTLIHTGPSTSTLSKQEAKAGDTHIEIHVEVGEIASDYDVEALGDTLGEIMYDKIRKANTGNVATAGTM